MDLKSFLIIGLIFLACGDARLIRHKRSRKFIRHASNAPNENSNSDRIRKDKVNIIDNVDVNNNENELNKNQLSDAMDKDFLYMSEPSDSKLVSDSDDLLLKSPKSSSDTLDDKVKKDVKSFPDSNEVTLMKGSKLEKSTLIQSSFGKFERTNESRINSFVSNVTTSFQNTQLEQDIREDTIDLNSFNETSTTTTTAPTLLVEVTTPSVSNESEIAQKQNEIMKETYFRILQTIGEAVYQRAAYIQRAASEFVGQQDSDTSNNQTEEQLMCNNVSLSDCRFEQVALICKTLCSAFNRTVEATDNCDYPASNNSCCVFPFMFQGKIFRSCTTIQKNVSWCSLTHNYDTDGKFAFCDSCSPWTKWSPCSVSCGLGDAIRTRNCTNADGVNNLQFQKIQCNGNCNNTVCYDWSPWSECTKPCGSGVQTRLRNCTLPDGSSQTFYEHQVCNTDECPKSPQPFMPVYAEPTTTQAPSVTSQARDDTVQPVEVNNCLLAYISFDSFQEVNHEVYDESDESNHMSISYQGPRMYNGNFTCGYSSYFFRHASFLHFRDDLFRNTRSINDLTISFWMKFTPEGDMNLSENRTQTLFYLDKSLSHFGNYHLMVDRDRRIHWTVNRFNISFFEDQQTGTPKTDNIQQCSVASNVILTPDEWYHVGAVFRDTPSTVSLFVNNDEITGGPVEIKMNQHNLNQESNVKFEDDGVKINVAGTKLDSSIEFQGMGNSPSLDSQFFGLMDEVYILKCPLDNVQVKSLANICRIREDSNCTSPLLGFCPDCPTCHHGPNKIGDLDLVSPQYMRIPHMVARK